MKLECVGGPYDGEWLEAEGDVMMVPLGRLSPSWRGEYESQPPQRMRTGVYDRRQLGKYVDGFLIDQVWVWHWKGETLC